MSSVEVFDMRVVDARVCLHLMSVVDGDHSRCGNQIKVHTFLKLPVLGMLSLYVDAG